MLRVQLPKSAMCELQYGKPVLRYILRYICYLYSLYSGLHPAILGKDPWPKLGKYMFYRLNVKFVKKLSTSNIIMGAKSILKSS